MTAWLWVADSFTRDWRPYSTTLGAEDYIICIFLYKWVPSYSIPCLLKLDNNTSSAFIFSLDNFFFLQILFLTSFTLWWGLFFQMLQIVISGKLRSVDASLVQTWRLKFGHKDKLLFRLLPQRLERFWSWSFRRDLEAWSLVSCAGDVLLRLWSLILVQILKLCLVKILKFKFSRDECPRFWR